jgi:hypothetical protein
MLGGYSAGRVIDDAIDCAAVNNAAVQSVLVAPYK